MKCKHCGVEVCMAVVDGTEQICVLEEEERYQNTAYAYSTIYPHKCDVDDVLKKRQKK